MKDTFVVHQVFDKEENEQGETIRKILASGVLSKYALECKENSYIS